LFLEIRVAASGEVIWGTLPFVLLMMLAVVVLCFVPGISTALPDLVMGPDGGR
jgi:TRAP-type C4-dicarboxylate transport system permease large subunit